MSYGITGTVRPRLFWPAKETICLILLLGLAPIAGWCQSAPELLRQTVENAHDSGELEVAGSRLIAVGFTLKRCIEIYLMHRQDK